MTPDLPHFISDSETIDEAILDGREALRESLDIFMKSGGKIPKPSKETVQWRRRLPSILCSK